MTKIERELALGEEISFSFFPIEKSILDYWGFPLPVVEPNTDWEDE